MDREVSFDLVTLAHASFLEGLLNVPLSRVMVALQWGRVIVLLLRGPPGEVKVYFCAVTCVFKEAAHAG